MLELIQLQWLLEAGHVLNKWSQNEVEDRHIHSYGANLFLNALFTILHVLLALVLIYYS
jgi:hypothetical protein